MGIYYYYIIKLLLYNSLYIIRVVSCIIDTVTSARFIAQSAWAE